MKASVFALALLATLALPARSFGQEATPTPNPLVYDDPAMHYAAPANAHAVTEQQHVALNDLSQDPTNVATWVVGTNQDNAKVISIVLESYTGSLDGFDSTFENQLRGDDPATLVKNRERVFLQNRMPAIFLDVTEGSGFTTRKLFAYIWIDTQRAVVLSVSAKLGALDEQTAKQLLAGATAVQYPSEP